MDKIEKIRKKIKELRELSEDHNYYLDNSEQALGYGLALDDIGKFLDSLPEPAKRGYKDCNGCEYNRTIKDQLGWQFRGCFGGEYKGKPIAEIELCPLKVETLPEQPVEGLEEEERKYMSERWKLGCTPITPVCLPNFTTDDLKECAEFFYRKRKDLDSYLHGYANGYTDKEAEQPSLPEGLEEAAKQFVGYDMDTNDLRDYEVGIAAFKAGAEWQKEQDLAEMAQSKSPLSVAYANRCFENGKQAMKEEMMKEAEECDLYYDGDFLAIDLNMEALGYCERDKVKIIIVKEDEK